MVIPYRECLVRMLEERNDLITADFPPLFLSQALEFVGPCGLCPHALQCWAMGRRIPSGNFQESPENWVALLSRKIATMRGFAWLP